MQFMETEVRTKELRGEAERAAVEAAAALESPAESCL